jgi:hypothetical protein
MSRISTVDLHHSNQGSIMWDSILRAVIFAIFIVSTASICVQFEGESMLHWVEWCRSVAARQESREIAVMQMPLKCCINAGFKKMPSLIDSALNRIYRIRWIPLFLNAADVPDFERASTFPYPVILYPIISVFYFFVSYFSVSYSRSYFSLSYFSVSYFFVSYFCTYPIFLYPIFLGPILVLARSGVAGRGTYFIS